MNWRRIREGLFLAVLFWGSTEASTVPYQLWEPSGSNIVIALDPIFGGTDFALFDSDGVDSLEFANGAVFQFTESSGIWSVANKNAPLTSVTLGSSPTFVLASSLGAGSWDMAPVLSGNGITWEMSFSNSTFLSVSPVQPVPLPPAFLLMAGATAGLFGIGYRTKGVRLTRA